MIKRVKLETIYKMAKEDNEEIKNRKLFPDGWDEKVYDYQERHKQGTLSEDEKETPPSTYVFNKVLLMDRLRPDIEKIGFKELLFEDRTYDLTTYAAEIIMKEGSLDDYVPEEAQSKNTGYCLLVYEKL